ncbi:hypothetical protein SE17_09645 [Kouleothrix aurantiaca]|uniref:Uncharacterized protein n=1 Tax=Kouleothrix aurantiaca TaxID=186479 RepID=A0A0N8PSR2_9CHLR|nr:hypothetical protein SE17_09645 [Kouleothrix aurantiaca]
MRIAVVITREQYRWLLTLAAKNTPHLRAHALHTMGNDKLTAEDVAGALIEAAFIRAQSRQAGQEAPPESDPARRSD